MKENWEEKAERLSKLLGYVFKDITLLRAAMSHRSIGEANNERLEFLGDSILNFVIAAELFKRFPKGSEGDLTRMRAMLVRGETAAQISRELNIAEYLNLGTGERKSGGFQRASILADALEAIIGAIYLDSNIEVCKARILAWFGSRLNSIVVNLSERDPKTELQEYMQARHLALPEYHVIKTLGDQHDPIFHVECSITLLPVPVLGVGGSRRIAEQKAAQAVLKELKNDK